MKSKVILKEKVENKDRLFGSGLSYYPVMVVDEDGEEIPALFTRDQVDTAISRAERNPEDIPEKVSLLHKIFS